MAAVLLWFFSIVVGIKPGTHLSGSGYGSNNMNKIEWHATWTNREIYPACNMAFIKYGSLDTRTHGYIGTGLLPERLWWHGSKVRSLVARKHWCQPCQGKGKVWSWCVVMDVWIFTEICIIIFIDSTACRYCHCCGMIHCAHGFSHMDCHSSTKWIHCPCEQ